MKTRVQVYLSSNETRFHRDVWINNTMSELYIHNLDRSAVYQIQISAHNQVGEGPASARLTIGLRLSCSIGVVARGTHVNFSLSKIFFLS